MINPLTLIPAKLRVALYLVYATAGPVLLYTKAQGWTGQNEIDLWVGLGVALGLTAASNITPPPADAEPLPQRAIPLDAPPGEVERYRMPNGDVVVGNLPEEDE